MYRIILINLEKEQRNQKKSIILQCIIYYWEWKVYRIPYSEAFLVLLGLFIPVIRVNGAWNSLIQIIFNTAGTIHSSIESKGCMGFLHLKQYTYYWDFSPEYLEWMVCGIPSSEVFWVLPGLFIQVLRMNGVWDSFLWSILNMGGVIHSSI